MVSAASAEIGLQPVVLRAVDLPAVAADRDLLARICERESVLAGRCWLLEIDDPVTESGQSARQFARRLSGPVAVACESPAEDDAGSLAIEISPAEPAELRDIWRSALAPAGPALAGWANRLAGQFSLGAADIGSIASEARPDDPDAGPRLWDACRSLARPALDGLAQRIIPRARWEDLVLPAVQDRLLREMTGHVRHRMTVFEDWGFGARTSRGSGVAALFAGAERHRQDDGRRGAGERAVARPVPHRPQPGGQQVHRRDREESARVVRRRRRAAARSCCSTRPTRCSASAARSRTATTATPTSRSATCCSAWRAYRGLAILTTN